MADDILEREVASLKQRLTLLEGEIRVFTPLISRLERSLWEFRAEASQRIDGVERRIDSVDQRVAAANQKIDRLQLEFSAKTDQIITLLRELVSK